MNTAGVFWTSGRDISGNGEFEWTAIKRSFNNFLNWAPGQPEVGTRLKYVFPAFEILKIYIFGMIS